MKKDGQLDRIDLKILAELQRNGRITNVELARAVNLSPSPCLERVRRLEKLGVIRGYGAFVNLDKLGPNITVFSSVTLRAHTPEAFTTFEDAIKEIPEIAEFYGMSGDYDYLIKVICSDTATFQSLMEDIISRDLGIQTYFPHVTLRTLKERSDDFPLDSIASSEKGKG